MTWPFINTDESIQTGKLQFDKIKGASQGSTRFDLVLQILISIAGIYASVKLIESTQTYYPILFCILWVLYSIYRVDAVLNSYKLNLIETRFDKLENLKIVGNFLKNRGSKILYEKKDTIVASESLGISPKDTLYFICRDNQIYFNVSTYNYKFGDSQPVQKRSRVSRKLRSFIQTYNP